MADVIAEGTLRLGRLQCRAHIGDAANVEALSLIFKQALSPVPPVGDVDIDLDLRESDCDESTASGTWPDVGRDALVVSDSGTSLRLSSEVIDAVLDRSVAPMTFVIRTRRHNLSADAFRVHLSVVLHRALLSMGMVYLHAAAVSLAGRTYLFVGEKGAGKSTLSVGLAKLGGTVLADDHVLLERSAPHYVVSGCEAMSRITAETEAYAFATPLDLPAMDFAGTMKKEFALAEHFAAMPYVAESLAAVYFPRVGQQLTVTPWSAQRVAMDLLDRTRRSFRPQSPAEVGLLLDFWIGLSSSAAGFALELDRDLRAIERLPGLLHV